VDHHKAVVGPPVAWTRPRGERCVSRGSIHLGLLATPPYHLPRALRLARVSHQLFTHRHTGIEMRMMTEAGTVTAPRCHMTATTATSLAAPAVATAAAAGSATRQWCQVTVTATTGGRVWTAAAGRRLVGGRTEAATAVRHRACVTPSQPAAGACSLVGVGPTCVRLASRRPRTGAL
jgi:hypothetical protein